MKALRELRETGDTIVEVLIAIMVISVVLVAAYQTTSRNTLATQDTQEHAIALNLAASQLEALQDKGSLDPSSLCFVGDAGSTVNSDCDIQPTPGGATYHVSLKPTPDGSGSYEALVTWAGLSDGNNKVSLFYRPGASTP